MECEKCGKKEATVHLTQVVDGTVQKIHLCEDCASDSGFDLKGPISITDILLGMEGVEKEMPELMGQSEQICSECGMTRSDFQKNGRLGCPHCYSVFVSDLVPLLKAMHHSEQHVGKVPSKESLEVRVTSELAGLKKALDQAVLQENFEEAASLRDQVQACLKRKADEGRTDLS